MGGPFWFDVAPDLRNPLQADIADFGFDLLPALAQVARGHAETGAEGAIEG